MKKLIITSNGRKIVFDDFTDEREEDYCGIWVGVCKKCAEKHKAILADHLDECGSGCCSVDGCSNEADYYADFFDGDDTINIEIKEVI